MRSIAAYRLIALLLILGLPMHEGVAATPSPVWRVAAREAWVHEAPSARPEAVPSAAALLLHDRQIRITAGGDDRYEHTIQRLAAAQTGQYAAQLQVNVDPRFQDLVIHALRLRHGGDAATVFSATQIRDWIRMQPAEADPHQRELAPRLQISLQIPGIQAGDILECEYTVHTRAARFPALLAGHYAAQWLTGADQPVQLQRLRVIWPPGRALQFRLGGPATNPSPQVHVRAGELDIQWRDLPAAVFEPDTPRWFERQSLVQLSDFATWAQVATLLAPQYGPETPDADPTHKDQTTDHGMAAAAPAMVLNALRLVQSKVHASPVAGAGPYAPADPALVLRRGFGDSRDLARLLASILQRLGIEAHVALADSRGGALLDTSLPSPFILDSGLVVARIGATEYWLNPAATGPAAALSTTDPAALRHALIIAATGGKVVTLPPAAPDSRLRRVTQQFDLRDGDTQPSTLTVTTQFLGSWAQAVRADLLAQSPAQLQLAQIQSVVQDYPDATEIGAVRLENRADDEAVQLTARFRLPRPFNDPRDPHFNFFAEALAAAVQPRDESTRRFPLSLPWPLKLEQHIDARLPPNLTIPSGKVVIENAAFRYERVVRFTPGMLHIDHSYAARSDHVDPANYPRFVQANAQVYQALGLRVQSNGFSWARALNWAGDRWLQIIAIAVVLGTLAVAARRRLRRE